MALKNLRSFYSTTITTAATAQPITNFSIPFYSANFHVYTNTIKYGSGDYQEAQAVANSTFDFLNGDLNDIFVKDAVGGTHGVIVVVCTVPTEYLKKILGGVEVGL